MSVKASPGEIGWRYSLAEIWADGAIHAVGVVSALVGAAVLSVMAWKTSGAYAAAVGVYLATLVLSIAASAAYNLWPVSRAKWILRRFDHSAIYLLIAGTYTPFMVLLGTWPLLATIWTVAGLGVVLKVFLPGRYDRLSIVLYLVLGWSGLAISDRLIAALSSDVLWLIGAGGVIYSAGVIFHVWNRLRFQNAIWHGFVLVASAIHYAAVWSAVTNAA